MPCKPPEAAHEQGGNYYVHAGLLLSGVSREPRRKNPTGEVGRNLQRGSLKPGPAGTRRQRAPQIGIDLPLDGLTDLQPGPGAQ